MRLCRGWSHYEFRKHYKQGANAEPEAQSQKDKGKIPIEFAANIQFSFSQAGHVSPVNAKGELAKLVRETLGPYLDFFSSHLPNATPLATWIERHQIGRTTGA